MIALVKTTGWEARLQSPQTKWLRTNSKQQKKCLNCVFFAPPRFILKERTFLSNQLVQTCPQSLPSLSQQVRSDMPTGYNRRICQACPCCSDQLIEATKLNNSGTTEKTGLQLGF